MAVDGEAGRRVVGDHRVRLVERRQLWCRGQLEPERELGAPRPGSVSRRGGAQAPQRRPATAGQGVAGARPRQLGQRRASGPRARRKVVERAEGAAGLAGFDERGDLVAAHAEDVAEAEAADAADAAAGDDAAIGAANGGEAPTRADSRTARGRKGRTSAGTSTTVQPTALALTSGGRISMPRRWASWMRASGG